MRYFITAFLFFGLFIVQSSLFSQSYLRVADPNDWITTQTSSNDNWHEYLPQGQFEDITLVVQPQGIYTQVEIFTTISQGEGYSWWGENMEIIWQFQLPQNAIVHDSWLWVGEDIIKADVVDFWTASQIYEEIVDRNQDPSLLYQLPNGSYEIRIFPLPQDDSRRIKMSFLIPNQWDKDQITTELIFPMLTSTDLYPEELVIIMPQSDSWQNPYLTTCENPEDIETFSNLNSPVYGPVHYASLPGQFLSSFAGLNLKTDAPWSENNSWLQVYEEEGGDKFYQLAFNPEVAVEVDSNLNNPDNALILIDRESSKTTVSKEALTQAIESYLLNSQNNIGAFNLLASTTNGTEDYGDSFWIPTTPLAVAATLTEYTSDTDSSDLASLLTTALAETANASIDKILLFSANDELVHPILHNELLTEITPLLPTETPINIYDFQDLNVSIIYEGGEVHEGNHYLFHTISQATGGTLYEKRNSTTSLDDALNNNNTGPTIEAPIAVMELNVDLTTGICYQEQDLHSSFFYEGQNPVFYQTGRFLGEAPFEIEASFVFNNGSYQSVETTINAEEVSQGDTLMREMWFGHHLLKESTIVNNNAERLLLIQQSIEERVLIPLTAFLALEPEQGGTVCIPCLDSTTGIDITDATEEKESASSPHMTVSPNPASTTASIKLTGVETSETAIVEIINAKGQIVEVLKNISINPDSTTWEWTIDEDIPAGVYICRIILPNSTLSQKIIVVK